MDEKPEAAVAPEAKTEATPNTNAEPEKTQEAPAAPDMHGFTSEQLADMQKFFQANGGYEKVKSKISNPTPAPAEEQKAAEPVKATAPTQEGETYTPPSGAITQGDLAIKLYFESLARQDKYKEIADDIVKGNVLKEMDALGIPYMNRDGSINPDKLFGFLDMKAKTVPAKQSSATPEASASPTVDYVPVGDTIKTMDEARAVIMQDSQLRARGAAGHPRIADAEAFMKNVLSPAKK